MERHIMRGTYMLAFIQNHLTFLPIICFSLKENRAIN